LDYFGNATFADSGTFCPAAGTVVKGSETVVFKGWEKPYGVKDWEAHSDFTRTWHGADSTGETCPATDYGPPFLLSAPRRREERYILAFYRAGSTVWMGDSEDQIRAGLAPVLSGQANSAVFNTANQRASTTIVWQSIPRVETWERIGEDTLIIDGQQVKTLRLRHTVQRYPGFFFGHRGVADLRYDSARHIFVIGVHDGKHSSYAFEMQSIKSP
jgi:hypothetical protein